MQQREHTRSRQRGRPQGPDGSGPAHPGPPRRTGGGHHRGANGLGVPLLPLARWVGRVAPVRPTHWVFTLCCPSVALRVCAVFGPLGSCSRVCPRGLLCCVCGVLGHLAPVHWRARSECCVACAVSWAPRLQFTGVPAGCLVLLVRCPAPRRSSALVRPLGVLLCLCGVLGHLAPVQRCACSVFCFVCAVSGATWLLFTGVPARCAAFCVRCPGPLGSCSAVCQAVVSCLFASLGACACAVFWPTWHLFTGVRAVCAVRVPLVVVSIFRSPLILFSFSSSVFV